MKSVFCFDAVCKSAGYSNTGAHRCVVRSRVCPVWVCRQFDALRARGRCVSRGGWGTAPDSALGRVALRGPVRR